MKISLNWLKKYVKINVSDEELIRLIGARLVEVEGVIDETHKYDKIYVVRVKTAEKIPDTHLTLCQIDVGTGELVQVVCGAPNVREGMLAAWIAPGATVPASVHEDAPFVIGKRKMLGKYESNGMLAGADELDFGDDHSGIVEIDPETAKPGDALSKVFGLNDLVLEIENKSLTHRPDAFGIIGFAREVAGILGVKFDEPELTSLDFGAVNKAEEVKINIQNAEICPRYSAVVLEKHGEFKKKYLNEMDVLLSKSGMRPVEQIVDITNYLMLLTGQPLHAFDFDKFVAVGGVGKPNIVVRLANDGEALTLIDGKDVVMNHNDIVITSNNVPVALAGAMGGESTAIDKNTRRIIIESATFSLYNLRKTQMAHGIFTEAITRFTKGQPPYQTLDVAKACVDMLRDGFVATSVSDEYLEREKEDIVKVSSSEINGLLGTDYDDKSIARTLENVGFTVKVRHGGFEVKAPLWRTDIHIKEDIIEEVGRLNGYDNITPTLPKHSTASVNGMWQLKTKVRDTLSKCGANEVLTYSFVSEKLLKKANLEAGNSYRIVNSISPELQLIRQSIVPSLLEKAYINQKLPIDKFAIFEINKVYQKGWGLDDEGVPVEKMRVGLVLAERKGVGDAYYAAKNYAVKLLEELNISAKFLPLKAKGALALPFEPKRAAEIWVNDTCIGVVGEFKNLVRRNFKLAEYLAGLEIDMAEMLRFSGRKVVSSNFAIRDKQDITITTRKDYADTLAEVAVAHPDAEITPVGIYQADGAEDKNITFHLEFR